MRHLDLFSGIGGFSLAADEVFEDVEHVFCDNEPFSRAVINKHWPNSPIYHDIKALTNTRSEESRWIPESERKGIPTSWEGGCDLLTGGFPCQPFSTAGRRRGTDDDRYLWPEMLRVIREFRPRWVIGENVGGLVTWSEGLVLEQIHTDLESEGYEVQTFVIPAVAVNAPHRRDRVWIVANSKRYGSRRKRRIQGHGEDKKESGDTSASFDPNDWSENWTEVATRLCRVDDGIPKRLDRNPRLKALGNAIVPQVAKEIMKVIKSINENQGTEDTG